MKFLLCLITLMIGIVCSAQQNDDDPINRLPDQHKISSGHLEPGTGTIFTINELIDPKSCPTCFAKQAAQGLLFNDTTKPKIDFSKPRNPDGTPKKPEDKAK